MNDDQMRAAILAALEQAAPGARTEGLDPTLPFRDQFEFDSVDFINFVMAIEKAFGVTVAETDCPSLSTLEGCEAVLRRMGAH